MDKSSRQFENKSKTLSISSHNPLYLMVPINRFFKQTKLTSFQRQLYLYGFARITRGPDSSGYYHEMFLRGKAFLCKHMSRTKVKGTKIKASSNPEHEPNFYRMPPLPPPLCAEENAALQVTDEASEDRLDSSSSSRQQSSSITSANKRLTYSQSSCHSDKLSNHNLSYTDMFQQELLRQSTTQRQRHPPLVLPPPPCLLSRRVVRQSIDIKNNIKNNIPTRAVEPIDIFASSSSINWIPEPLPISSTHEELSQQTMLNGAFGRMIELFMDDASSVAL